MPVCFVLGLTIFNNNRDVHGRRDRAWTRIRIVRSDDGNLAVSLRLPEALGGPGGGTNAEQLFAASYAGCSHGALYLLATKARIPIPDTAVEVCVTFGRDPVGGLYLLTASVQIHLPSVERAVAEEPVRNTEQACPSANLPRQRIASEACGPARLSHPIARTGIYRMAHGLGQVCECTSPTTRW